MRWELGKQFKQSRKGNPPCSTKAFVRTTSEIVHHDVLCSEGFADEVSDIRP
jgi:hypothetical protein